MLDDPGGRSLVPRRNSRAGLGVKSRRPGDFRDDPVPNMRRYALTSLLIAAFASLVVFALYFFEAFEPMLDWLVGIYRARYVLSPGEPRRLEWLEMTVIVLASLGVAWAVVDMSAISQKILVALAALFVVFGLSPALAFHDLVFEPFSSCLAVFLAAVAGLAFAGTERGMRKRVLEGVLGARVSHRSFDDLLEAPDPPEFNGAERDITVLTCRLFQGEEIRSQLEPAEAVKMSNLFLRSVTTFLTSKGAYLDESGPDLVRAYFGMLQPNPAHAADACRAALELRSRLRNLSHECEGRWFQPLRYGVGISSGKSIVGVYGAREHLYFSGIGADTDYTRRLAHANLRYGSDLLVGPKTYALVEKEFEFRPMEMLYDPEKDAMTEIYQLLGAKGSLAEEEAELRDLFWKGVILRREGRFEEALEFFSQVRRSGVEDGPLEFFLDRVQAELAGSEQSRPGLESGDSAGKGHARLSNLM